MVKKSGIYQILNKVNNKRYIGSAVDLRKRLNNHIDNKWSNIPLQRAIKKYGKENFSIKIVEYVEHKKDLIKCEQKWIDKFKFSLLYNIAPKAGSNLDMKVKESTKRKLREANLGKKMSKTARENMRKAQKGKKFTEKAKRNALLAKLGVPRSEATKAKISKNSTLKTPINQINPDTGEVIKKHGSTVLAAKNASIAHTNISACCNKKVATVGGYVWRHSSNTSETKRELVSSSVSTKPVIRLDVKTGQILGVYRSATVARDKLSISNTTIGIAAKDSSRTAGGFKWKFISPTKFAYFMLNK